MSFADGWEKYHPYKNDLKKWRQSKEVFLTFSILCFTMPYNEPAMSLGWVDEDTSISEIADEG